MYSKIALLSFIFSVVSALPNPQVSRDPSSSVTPSKTSTQPVPTDGSINPCAAISSLVASTPGMPGQTVPAKLAYDCLNDVALDAEAAVPWLQSLRPYLDWQTTLAYLKNPPEGYLEPAIDVMGELDDLISSAMSGSFTNEYDLEFQLYRIFQRAHDGHFRYYPNLVGNVLTFGRPVSLVSVSMDGNEVPKPYVYSDILWSLTARNITPSAITKINGEDANTYLETWSQYGALQDPDALYNNVFYSLAQNVLGSIGSGPGTFAGAGRGAYVYPNESTVLEFENGTTSTYENFARVLQPFVGINSGRDVYESYVNPNSGTQESTQQLSTLHALQDLTAIPAEAAALPGFPQPVLEQANHFIGGYYLNGTGYDDVAVLSVPSFVSYPTVEQAFQDTAFNFINKAKADGKTKLVIDVSANGGGTIMQGYSLFTNLFPDLFPYGATRLRAHDAVDVIGQTVSDRIPIYPYDATNPPNETWAGFVGTPFNYRSDVDVDNKNFESWAQKYGPHEFEGDNFTSIIRWNLSDPTLKYTNGIVPNGFQNRTGIINERPFAAENIVVLYDGYCASTCTIFSEMMRQQGGVKTIAIGGRPQADTAMQAVGGVKGANNYGHAVIMNFVNGTYTLAPDLTAELDKTALADYGDITPFLRAVPGSGEVNVRDGLRQGDESQTPLQFIYEAADCRIWYTPEMTIDVSAMWEKAADVSWNGDKCVYGSVSSGGSGGYKRHAIKKRKIRQLSQVAASELEKTLEFFGDLRGIPQRQGFMSP